jgi:hypothetical protein
MNIEATQRLMLAFLTYQNRLFYEEQATMYEVLCSSVAQIMGRPFTPPVNFGKPSEDQLIQTSRLLAERVIRPKYGKGKPLATLVELCEAAGTVEIEVSLEMTGPEDVADALWEAGLNETKNELANLRTLTWNEWKLQMELLQKVAKKQGVTEVALLELPHAERAIVKSMFTIPEYRKMLRGKYEAYLEKAFGSMVPKIMESALTDLAGANSPSYGPMNAAVPEMKEMIAAWRRIAYQGFMDLTERQIEEIWK